MQRLINRLARWCPRLTDLPPPLFFFSNFLLEPNVGWAQYFVVDKLQGPALRKLKSMAQLLDPVVFVGKRGISEELILGLNSELERHELVKVKFTAFKEEKKRLSVELSDKTGSHLVSRVGNVAVFFRRNEDPQKKRINLPG